MFFKMKILSAALFFSLLFVNGADGQAQQPQPPGAAPKATAPAAQGSPRKATNVAVLDEQRILREAKSMKSARDQLTAMRKKFEGEIEKKQGELRTANEELRRQRSILAPDAFDAERRKFDQRVAEVQKLVQTRNQQLERANAETVLQVQKVYNQIVVELANERSYGMIFRKTATIVVHPPIEITPEVLARLDKRLPAVKVTEPK
ncbi:MAG: OmpH family outer membrane protein [Rhodospirillaceae bacterium]